MTNREKLRSLSDSRLAWVLFNHPWEAVRRKGGSYPFSIEQWLSMEYNKKDMWANEKK